MKKKVHAKNKISLDAWINEIGVGTVAKLLKVQEATVRHWRRGFCLPRADQMQKIKRFSKSAVPYDQMIDGHFDKAKKSAKAKSNSTKN